MMVFDPINQAGRHESAASGASHRDGRGMLASKGALGGS
jgi:hypothetical protein